MSECKVWNSTLPEPHTQKVDYLNEYRNKHYQRVVCDRQWHYIQYHGQFFDKIDRWIVDAVEKCPIWVAKIRGDTVESESSIPEVAGEKTFASYDSKYNNHTDIVTECKFFINNPDPYLVLQGKPRIGKSHLAMAIINRATKEAGYPGRVITYQELLRIFQNMRSFQLMEKAKEEHESLLEVKFLLIDEMNAGGSIVNEFQDVLDKRMLNKGKTILTTNLNKEMIRESFNSRILGRLEPGIITMQGKPWRE